MSKAVACSSCGFKNPDTAKRCASCGASVEGPRSVRSGGEGPGSKRYQQGGFSVTWLGLSLAVLVVLIRSDRGEIRKITTEVVTGIADVEVIK